MDHDLDNHLRNPERLRALRDTALLDSPTEVAFDRLSRLATRYTRAPVALVSLVESDRQFFKSCIGLPEPWASLRGTPISQSFCQHNRIVGSPLAISDAREDPRFSHHPAIRDLGVIAYLGIPLTTPDGHVLGSFCVIDHVPRNWSGEDIAVVDDLAAAVMTEIHLRTEIRLRRRVENEREELAELNRRLEQEMAARLRAEAERRQMEIHVLQAQKLDSLGLLAGGVAHDFNNLLFVMLAGIDLMQVHAGTDPELLPQLGQLRVATERASELVHLLLTYAGHGEPRQEACDLKQVVAGTVRLLTPTLRKRVSLELDLAPELPPILADPAQLRQVVMNLLLNAADASEAGATVRAQVSMVAAGASDLASLYLPASEIPPPGDYVLLEIADHGSGMDAETRERLFDPFYTTKPKGHGLGLAVILGVIRSTGGSIQVESEAGAGSTFRLWFPISNEPRSTGAGSSSAGRSSQCGDNQYPS